MYSIAVSCAVRISNCLNTLNDIRRGDLAIVTLFNKPCTWLRCRVYVYAMLFGFQELYESSSKKVAYENLQLTF